MNNNLYNIPQGYYQFNYPAAAPAYAIPQPQQLPPLLKGRPVSSFEEAKVAQVDLDGSTFIFPDLANKKIYTKRINPDGTAALSIFSLEEQKEDTTAYATKDEIESLRKTLEDILAKIKNSEKVKINF